MTRRDKSAHAMLVMALAIAASPSCIAQQIFWARCLPTSPRQVWIHGRELWTGSEYDTRSAKAALDGVPLTWDRMSGANGHDANRALPFVQRFFVPPSIVPATTTLTFTRNDGLTVSVPVEVPAATPLSPKIARRSPQDIDVPIVVPDGETYDGCGVMVRPSALFSATREKAVVVVGSGSRVTNLGIYIDEQPPGAIVSAIAVNPNASGVIIDGCAIVNGVRGGYGIRFGHASKCVIANASIMADRAVECGPSDRLTDNTFYRCLFGGARHTNDSQAGRAFQGSRHLIAWCMWSQCDRGPTVGPWGAPNDRSLYWECFQQWTGTSTGASEGLLFESLEAIQCPASIDADGTITATTSGDAKHCRQGNFVVCLDGTGAAQSWARIVTISPAAGVVMLTTDPPLPAGNVTVRIGNAIAENTVARCLFTQGKSGIWFFGAALGNAVIQNDFRTLDAGIVQLQRASSLGSAFSLGLIDKHNQFRNCGVDRRTIP